MFSRNLTKLGVISHQLSKQQKHIPPFKTKLSPRFMSIIMSSFKAPKLSHGNANTTGNVGVEQQILQTL